MENSQTRVLAFVNIVGAGMEGACEQDVSEMDPKSCAEMISRYPDVIVGSKTAHFSREGWAAVDGAVEAARLSGTIAMIDFAPQPTRSYRDMLDKLAPGDIHTHGNRSRPCVTGVWRDLVVLWIYARVDADCGKSEGACRWCRVA